MWTGRAAMPSPVIVEDRRRARPATVQALNGGMPAQMVHTSGIDVGHRRVMVGSRALKASLSVLVIQLEFDPCH